MDTNTRVPISLEELLAKRRQAEEDSLRPKFLTKAEREKLAEEERLQEEARRKDELEKLKLQRKRFLEESKNGGSRNDDHKMVIDNESSITEAERNLLKSKYLGIQDESERKKPRRFTEKKFVFDWDESEDTSKQQVLTLPTVSKATKDSFSLSRKRFDERHWSEKALKDMNDRDWRIFKEDYNINTSGGSIPDPIRNWEESGLPSSIISTIKKLGYKEPTAIQRQAIPLGLNGRDFIGVAETGSGKTASFILPMITEIMKLPAMNADIAANGPYGLVVVPTRELANQIETEARKFLQPLGYRCFAIVGGHSIAEQSFSLRNGAEIIIATPGRLRDCLDQHVLVLNQCKHVVLDEADRMIDLNFEEDLQYILDCIPRDTSTNKSLHITMFSATMPVALEKLAKGYLVRPATVSIGQVGAVADTIEQRVELIKEDEKPNRLADILRSEVERFAPPIIIFVNQKKTVDYLTKRLDTFGFKTVSLHGGKGQDQREAALSLLRTGQKDILVATDVAGRGIDVKNVSLVVNYDMARSIEDYVHRVGRTGRAGSIGTSITFLTGEDTDLYYDLRILLQKSSKTSVPSEFMTHEAARMKPQPSTEKKRQFVE